MRFAFDDDALDDVSAGRMRARAEARLGSTLRGKYRLDRVLGVGGMAVVYKATHRNRAEFAVKMLHPQLSMSTDVRSRFLREGYAANSVKHPGAVLVVDDDVGEDGAAFLVMELLDGVPCDGLWEQSGRRLTAGVASAMTIQLLDVLAAAHDKGIVHRDIKPANLFITRTGTVKVLDFGIARVREAVTAGVQPQGTSTGMMLGTPAFMAPEQARGRVREVDGRTDLWAVGASFFWLTSGQFVHSVAETPHELLIEAATKPARALATVAPDVPVALAAVIDRALAFQREARWPTAAGMRDALVRAHHERFGSATPESVLASALGSLGIAHARTLPSEEPWPSHEAPARPAPALGLSTASPLSRDGVGERTPTSPLVIVGAAIVLGAVAGAGVLLMKAPHPAAAVMRAEAGDETLLGACAAYAWPRSRPTSPAPGSSPLLRQSCA